MDQDNNQSSPKRGGGKPPRGGQGGAKRQEAVQAPKKLSKRTSGTMNRRSRSRKDGPKLRVIPLGGLDGIGKNMTAFECGDDMIVIDAGIMFPDDGHPGIDLILPDYTYVLEHADKLRGIFITHGHEDHTGALPYLVKDLGAHVPILGTKLTLGFINGKFEEHRLRNEKLTEVHPGDHVELGCFSLDFFAVNHSIPGALGVYLRCPAGSVLHTGDFKLDQTPIDGVRTDFNALSHFGHLGVDLMMSDSTNAQKTEFTKSEAEVGKALRPIIASAKQRVIVAAFSSHIHRVQQVYDAAVACGRKVVVTGRSMVQNTKIAEDLGYLHVDSNNIIDAYDMNDLPPEKVVVLCTGSQGEPLSALARMANGEHRTVSIEAGDTVIISATPVPGNEKAVTRVINCLAKIGAEVYDKSRALVHVSGHAGSEELKLVLSIVQPKYFMPVHGEAAHLRAHARLAEAVGIPHDHIFVMDNGDTLTLDHSGVRRGAPIEESGVVFVDGMSVGDTSPRVLRDRTLLAGDGVVICSVAVDAKKDRQVGPTDVIMRGVSGGDDPELIEDACARVEKALADTISAGKGHDVNALEKSVREAVSKLLWDRLRRRPVVIPTVIKI